MAQPLSSGPSIVDQQLGELERKINVEKKMQLAALQMQEALRSAPNSTSSSTSSLAQPVEPPHWVVKEQQQLSSSEAAQMKQIQVTLAESYERTTQLQLEYDRLLQAKANGVKPTFQPGHGKSLSHSQLPTQRYPSSDTAEAGTTLIGDELGEQSGRMLSIKHRSRSMTNLLDASKSDGSLSRVKVLFKINEITKKLEIESRIMAGAEKLLHAHSEQKQLLPDLQHKLKTSQDKIQLLKTSLTKYQKMMLQYPEPGPLLQSADSESDLGPNMHQPPNYYKFTGRLKAKVVAANGLVQRKAKSDVYVVVRVDNIERARTKGKAKMIWQEDFDLKMHNAREVEFELYDKSGEILALLFFKIEELEQEIAHRQEVVINLPTTKGLGFAPPHNGSGRSSVENLDGGLPPTVEVPSDAAGGWYELEPMGQLQVVLKLTALTERDTKEMQRQQRQEGAKGGLKRHAAVKKRRLHIVNGHKFVKQQFYGIMKCAYCGDTLISAGGYQCQDCKYLCHKKCHEKIVTKCISTSSTEMSAQEQRSQDAQVLKHNVPHRFDSTTNFTPVWCCHCGYMLPIGRKGAQKCTECSVHCHATCEIFIPNFCGMSMKMANDLLFHAQMIEKKRKELLQRTEEEKLQRETQAVAEPPVETSQPLQKSSSGVLAQDQPTVKLPHKATLEDFHFIAVLGKGNFGKVMLAEEKRSRNLYAIKVLKKEFILENDEVESCKSEKRVFLTANRARHPFLVGLHSCFQTETRIYFVEEYISGGDLMLHIQREQFNEKRAKFYACEVLLALEYFHANGIIYRDLKLDNLLLTLDGHVKVADYGLCKENMWFGKTTNTFCGTPEFMAPEILLEQDYTRAVDWWAFGVLIFEMLLGQSPFRGDDEEEIFEAILEEEVLYPANMTKESVDILKKLLMKNPTHRLGYGRADSQEIKDHPFFAGVSWQDVYHKKIPVPFKPTLSHAQDISNFDEEFTREMPILTPVQNALNQADQDEFRGFSYTAGWAASRT